MNIHRVNFPLETRILFAWDGTANFISKVDDYVRLLRGQKVYSVHAMPHESIYDYGSVNCISKVKPRAAERLESQFRRLARRSEFLKNSRLELLFGDRIDEIVVAAAQLQAKFILMPRFIQTTFSKWIHGDLNEKISRKATCHVVFLDGNISDCWIWKMNLFSASMNSRRQETNPNGDKPGTRC